MDKILLNLAHIDLLNFCKANKIDPAGVFGSTVIKLGRGFTYALVSVKDMKTIIATVTFHKSQVPTHTF